MEKDINLEPIKLLLVCICWPPGRISPRRLLMWSALGETVTKVKSGSRESPFLAPQGGPKASVDVRSRGQVQGVCEAERPWTQGHLLPSRGHCCVPPGRSPKGPLVEPMPSWLPLLRARGRGKEDTSFLLQKCFQKIVFGNSLVVQCQGHRWSTALTQVQSLARELRSCKKRSAANNKKERKRYLCNNC